MVGVTNPDIAHRIQKNFIDPVSDNLRGRFRIVELVLQQQQHLAQDDAHACCEHGHTHGHGHGHAHGSGPVTIEMDMAKGLPSLTVSQQVAAARAEQRRLVLVDAVLSRVREIQTNTPEPAPAPAPAPGPA